MLIGPKKSFLLPAGASSSSFNDSKQYYNDRQTFVKENDKEKKLVNSKNPEFYDTSEDEKDYYEDSSDIFDENDEDFVDCYDIDYIGNYKKKKKINYKEHSLPSLSLVQIHWNILNDLWISDDQLSVITSYVCVCIGRVLIFFFLQLIISQTSSGRGMSGDVVKPFIKPGFLACLFNLAAFSPWLVGLLSRSQFLQTLFFQQMSVYVNTVFLFFGLEITRKNSALPPESSNRLETFNASQLFFSAESCMFLFPALCEMLATWLIFCGVAVLPWSLWVPLGYFSVVVQMILSDRILNRPSCSFQRTGAAFIVIGCSVLWVISSTMLEAKVVKVNTSQSLATQTPLHLFSVTSFKSNFFPPLVSNETEFVKHNYRFYYKKTLQKGSTEFDNNLSLVITKTRSQNGEKTTNSTNNQTNNTSPVVIKEKNNQEQYDVVAYNTGRITLLVLLGHALRVFGVVFYDIIQISTGTSAKEAAKLQAIEVFTLSFVLIPITSFFVSGNDYAGKLEAFTDTLFMLYNNWLIIIWCCGFFLSVLLTHIGALRVIGKVYMLHIGIAALLELIISIPLSIIIGVFALEINHILSPAFALIMWILGLGFIILGLLVYLQIIQIQWPPQVTMIGWSQNKCTRKCLALCSSALIDNQTSIVSLHGGLPLAAADYNFSVSDAPDPTSLDYAKYTKQNKYHWSSFNVPMSFHEPLTSSANNNNHLHYEL